MCSPAAAQRMPGPTNAKYSPLIQHCPGFHGIPSGLRDPKFEHEFECVARQQCSGCRDKSMPKYSLFTHLPGFHDIPSRLRDPKFECVARQQRSECRGQPMPNIHRLSNTAPDSMTFHPATW
ncbi:hypothetical protein [Celerinatantimonas sp. YJH-8]|uniref:hypothetical protein n=1 Tax=Celerinatantimonas sp. YJH-8 TaxID=3228714 RepID=UPI0038CA7B98